MPEPNTIKLFLTHLKAFSELPAKALAVLAEQITEVRHPAGKMLAIQGKTVIEQLLIIREGVLELYFTEEDKKTSKGILTHGGIFGGISILVNNGVAVRNVQVREALTAYALPGELFIDLCKRHEAFHTFFVDAFHASMRDPEYAAFFQQGRIIGFLSGTLPFSFLPEADLKAVAEQLETETHPKGTLLFVQGKTNVNRLYIINSGEAERFYDEGGEKLLRGTLGPGDTYGGISMLFNDGVSVRTVQINADTRFYTLAGTHFLRLCHDHASFSEYFTDTFGKRMIDRSYAAIIKQEGDQAATPLGFFNLRVKDIHHQNILSCLAGTSIQAAAEAMSRHNCSSVFIKTTEDVYTGVVTDTDLRQKVVARGVDIQKPVAEIMSSPLRGSRHCT
ncbi:MAG: cyclic nucleotide-binding domain-containing protein [Desulfatitalea sp.]|nr:cyclic nucleotide-binding domain-containing protein [Desulfatitalea sp.]NNK02624.1 cyclic nucleotide-binding domain-containing protein [Desulfatitalea sp.]